MLAARARPARRSCAAATPADGAAIVEVKGLVHEQLRHCGPNTREPWMLRRLARRRGPLRLPRRRRVPELPVGRRHGGDRGRGAHRGARPRRPARSGRSWPRTPAWPAGSAPASAPDDPVTWLTRDPAATTSQAEPGCCGSSTPRRPSPRAATRPPPAFGPARSRRRRPARQLRPLGAGGVRRRGQPDPAGRRGARHQRGRAQLGPRGFAALYAGDPGRRTAPGWRGRPAGSAADDAVRLGVPRPAFMVDNF